MSSTSTKPRVFSYCRFSSLEQGLGKSEQRQVDLEQAYVQRQGLTIEDGFRLVDRGRSGFHGTHRKKGLLGKFLAKVKAGEVPRGSILLVENCDRLSREGVYRTLKNVVFELIEHGITIQTLAPEMTYDEEALGDWRMNMLVQELQRGYAESKRKSDLSKAGWREKRQAALQGEAMTGKCPAWLRREGDGPRQKGEKVRLVLIPERVEVVQRIFTLSAEGQGLFRIASILNQERVPTFGRSGQWNHFYIGLILRNRAVLGEGQPHAIVNGKRQPSGPPIPNYYPAIVSVDLFRKANKAVQARKLQRGPRGKGERNLFTGLLHDAKDGSKLVTVSPSARDATLRLVSAAFQNGKPGATPGTYRYQLVEDAVLRFLRELQAADLRPLHQVVVTPVDDLQASRDDLKSRIHKLQASLRTSGDFDAGLSLLRTLQDDLQAVQAQLEEAEAEAANPPSEVLTESQTIAARLDQAQGEEKIALRVRLKQRIAELVQDLRLLVEDPLPALRIGVVQLTLREPKTNPLVRQIGIVEVRKGPLQGSVYAVAGAKYADALPDLRHYAADASVRQRLTTLIAGIVNDFQAQQLADTPPEVAAAEQLLRSRQRQPKSGPRKRPARTTSKVR